MWKLFITSGLHSCLVCVLNFLFKCCVQSSCEPIWQYTLWNDGMCVCSSVACTSLCTCMHSAMAGSILRWSCQLTRSWHPISMLLMIPDRLESTLQVTSLHVGMCDCSSASDVLSTWAICVRSVLPYMQVLLAFFGAWCLCDALSYEADQLDRIKHLNRGISIAELDAPN